MSLATLSNYASFFVRTSLECGCIWILINISFSIKSISRLRFSIILGCYVFLEIMVALSYDSAQTNNVLLILIFLLRYGKTIAFFLLLFKKNAFKIIVCYYIIFALVISIFTQTVLFISKVPIQYSQISSGAILNWIDSFFCAIFLGFILLSLKNLSVVSAIRNFSLLPIKTFILVIAAILCMALLENSVLSQLSILDFTSKVSQYSSVFATTFLIVLIIYLIIINNSKNIFENTTKNLTEQINAQISHYETLKFYDDEMRRFQHDFNNMRLCMKALLQAAQVQEALDFIDNMATSIHYDKLNFDSGNYIADALLSEKKRKASLSNTKLEFDGFIPSYRITNFDLCIILSNALDNAVEACSEINGEKIIEITSRIKNNMWFLTITNPVKDKVIIRHNTITTTKMDTTKHGFGLYNIEQTIKKGGGRLTLSCTDTTFMLDIIIKLNNV